MWRDYDFGWGRGWGDLIATHTHIRVVSLDFKGSEEKEGRGIERKGKTNEDENQLWESVYIIKSPRPSLMQMRVSLANRTGKNVKVNFFDTITKRLLALLLLLRLLLLLLTP